jgi:hypothetical protein
MLHPDVRVHADATARKLGDPERAQGAAAVASWLSTGARGLRMALVDGAAGLVWAPRGRPRGMLDLALMDGKIVELNLIADPKRMNQSEIVLLDN